MTANDGTGSGSGGKGPVDDRSPMATAIGLSSVIVSIALELVIPGLIGHWLDRRWGTGPVLVLLGFLLGMAVAGWHLVRVVAKLSAAEAGRRSKRQL
ncbi:MAG TPA: AtpZ/AtpI family protein [Pirellulales bacterium]|nr:AtpZ/AtpI family protein [Pirellulales bacterium]